MVPMRGDTRATSRADVSQSAQPARAAQSRHRASMGAARARITPRRAILRALPPQATPAASQDAWLREIEEHPAAALLRADARAHLLEVAGVLAWTADWADLTTRPTWERLCDRTGLSRRTVARWLAWLREHRLLGVVETGSTPQLRPMALAHLEGNRAALYVLSSASGDETGTPSDLTEGESPTRTREAPSNHTNSPLRGPDRRKAAATEASWGWCTPTTHRRSRLGCSQRLQERVPALRRLSDRHLRSLLRPWLLAGWSAADVLYALDHAPDGTSHTWTTQVRSPSGWLTHRLGLWTDEAGAPVAPLSAATRARTEATRKRQDQERERVRAVRAVRAVELDLGDRLSAAAGASWAHLVEAIALRAGRRRAGPMAESLARTRVLELLPDPTTSDAEQLRAAVEAAWSELLGGVG